MAYATPDPAHPRGTILHLKHDEYVALADLLLTIDPDATEPALDAVLEALVPTGTDCEVCGIYYDAEDLTIGHKVLCRECVA